MLNEHVLVRIGGGWDGLEHYLMTHVKHGMLRIFFCLKRFYFRSCVHIAVFACLRVRFHVQLPQCFVYSSSC